MDIDVCAGWGKGSTVVIKGTIDLSICGELRIDA